MEIYVSVIQNCNHALQNIENQQCDQMSTFHQVLLTKTAKSCTNISTHSYNTSGQYNMYVPKLSNIEYTCIMYQLIFIKNMPVNSIFYRHITYQIHMQIHTFIYKQ